MSENIVHEITEASKSHRDKMFHGTTMWRLAFRKMTPIKTVEIPITADWKLQREARYRRAMYRAIRNSVIFSIVWPLLIGIVHLIIGATFLGAIQEMIEIFPYIFVGQIIALPIGTILLKRIYKP